MVYTMGNRALAFALTLLIVAPLAVVAVILLVVVERVVVIVFDDADDDNDNDTDDAKPEQQTQQERLMIKPIQRIEFRIEEETIVKKNAIVSLVVYLLSSNLVIILKMKPICSNIGRGFIHGPLSHSDLFYSFGFIRAHFPFLHT